MHNLCQLQIRRHTLHLIDNNGAAQMADVSRNHHLLQHNCRQLNSDWSTNLISQKITSLTKHYNCRLKLFWLHCKLSNSHFLIFRLSPPNRAIANYLVYIATDRHSRVTTLQIFYISK